MWFPLLITCFTHIIYTSPHNHNIRKHSSLVAHHVLYGGFGELIDPVQEVPASLFCDGANAPGFAGLILDHEADGLNQDLNRGYSC